LKLFPILKSVAITAVLSGCAGAMHQIPDVSSTELSLAGDEVDFSEDMTLSDRSTEENRKMTVKISNTLHKFVEPICEQAGREKCWFDVGFIDEDVFNAYASPENKISIYQGIAKYIQTEDELAAIIGHEMGHHISKHLDKGAQNTIVGQLVGGLLYGVIAASSGGAVDQNVMNDFMNTGALLGQNSYSVEHEREADYIAAYLLKRAGYDLEKARGIWVKMSKYSGKSEAALFDSHPIGPFRMIAWDKTIAEIESSSDLLPKLMTSDQPVETTNTGSKEDSDGEENLLDKFFSW
jgi:predicted Zn-dependent protease